MLSKNQIKHIRQLQMLKYRRQFGEFIAEGPKVVGELLQSTYRIKAIYAVQDWIERNPDYVNISIQITTKELAQISQLKTPNQVLCIAEAPQQASLLDKKNQGLHLVLDGISDPGNMGTIIRTADWFGIRGLICSPDCVDVFNPKVVQATMGSIARIQIQVAPLDELMRDIPSERKIYGAYLEGDNLFETSLLHDSYLVIGSESHGISENVGRYINQRLSIPRVGQSGAESLNASVATAIFCAEYYRQHKE